LYPSDIPWGDGASGRPHQVAEDNSFPYAHNAEPDRLTPSPAGWSSSRVWVCQSDGLVHCPAVAPLLKRPHRLAAHAFTGRKKTRRREGAAAGIKANFGEPSERSILPHCPQRYLMRSSPSPSGAIVSSFIVLPQTMQEMSVTSGLWSSLDMIHAFIRRERRALSHLWLPMAGGDGGSMRPEFQESLVNIAHSRKFHEFRSAARYSRPAHMSP
jgi:hypothetical protein